MPRSSVVLSPEPLGYAAVSAAAAELHARALTSSMGSDEPDAADVVIDVRTMDGGALLQVLVDDVVVLSLLRPRLLPHLDELSRLLPRVDASAATRWWADAYTPWRPEGAIGLEILDAAAAASDAFVVHQDIAR